MQSVVKVKLTELTPYLTDLISTEDTDWALRQAAWSACQELELPLRPKWRETYRQACQQRLTALEAELYAETIRKRMRELNDERLAILEQLASRENLPLLLSRRFVFIPDSEWDETSWNERVAELLDELIDHNEPSTDFADAWTILTEPVADSGETFVRWFDTFREGDELLAHAAAHRLIEWGEELPENAPSRAGILEEDHSGPSSSSGESTTKEARSDQADGPECPSSNNVAPRSVSELFQAFQRELVVLFDGEASTDEDVASDSNQAGLEAGHNSLPPDSRGRVDDISKLGEMKPAVANDGSLSPISKFRRPDPVPCGRRIWWQLSALARLAAATEDESLAEPLDQLIRWLIDRVSGREQVEALANLVTALWQLDSRRGHRTAAVADMVFWNERWDETLPAQFPWQPIFNAISLDDSDCVALLTSSNPASSNANSVKPSQSDQQTTTAPQQPLASHHSSIPSSTDDLRDRRAAIYFLQAWGGGIALAASANDSPIQLSTEAASAFCELAAVEAVPRWRWMYAKAAIKAEVVSLLPWLAQTADLRETAENVSCIWDSDYGRIEESDLGDFLRSIGFLTRRLLDDGQRDAAQVGIDALEKRRPLLAGGTISAEVPEAAAASADEAASDEPPHRSIIRGLVTALGYLGDWQPLLEQLRDDEPWLHEAAKNVFEHWVPGPLVADPDGERERAGQWIVTRLRLQDLAPNVRSTLEELLHTLEQKLGHHIRRS